MLKKVTSLRFLVGIVASFAIAGGAYAFTASNTVPTSNVGAGSGTVSGYTVTNLHYTLDVTTPSNIDQLTFNVSPSISSTGSGKVSVSAALTSAARTPTRARPTSRVTQSRARRRRRSSRPTS